MEIWITGGDSIAQALADPEVSVLCIGAGSYSGAIELSRPIRIIGSGACQLRGSIRLLPGATLTLINMSVTGPIDVGAEAELGLVRCAVEVESGDAVTLRDNSLTAFETTRLLSASGAALVVSDRAVLEAEGCSFASGGTAPSLRITGNSRVTLTECNLAFAGGDGILVDDDAVLTAEKLAVAQTSGVGLTFTGRSTGRIQDAGIDTVEHQSVVIRGEARATLVGGHFSAAMTTAIRICGQARPILRALNVVGGGEAAAVALEQSAVAEMHDCLLTGGGVGLAVDGDAELRVASSSISGATLSGILIAGNANASFRDSQIEQNRAANLFVSGGRATFEECRFVGTAKGYSGVYIAGGAVRLLRCMVSESGDAGIEMGERGQAEIIGCSSRNNAGPGFVRHPNARAQLQGNDFDSRAQEDLGARIARLAEAMATIDSMIGLESVKRTIRDFASMLEVNADREAAGLAPFNALTLHSAFLGAPGTGKTTLARQLGAVLHALGLLSRGHLVEVTRQDLIAPHVGQTAIKTAAKIDEAMGGVLFIDEAYSLVTGPEGSDFGREAIDVLTKRMEDDRGDLAVIVAGYPDSMIPFLNANPGLSSRFAFHFVFEDFDPDQLMTIFRAQIAQAGLKITPEALDLMGQEFALRHARRNARFGNGRMVRTLVESAQLNQARRVATLPREDRSVEELERLDLADVEPLAETLIGAGAVESLERVMTDLDALVGLQTVKQQLRELFALVQMSQERRSHGLPSALNMTNHSLYLGNPGTGKTTVARLMGRAFRALGILPRGHVVEVSRADLVAGYIGQTAAKTRSVIERAIGGVLFIDEAYSLATPYEHDFGREAIDVLNAEIENRRGEFIVIAAGYPADMERFLLLNAGLTSRFAHRLTFEDHSSEELLTIFERLALGDGFTLAPDAVAALRQQFAEPAQASQGGGRRVRTLLEYTRRRHAMRLISIPSGERTRDNLTIITAADLLRPPT